MLFVVVFVEMSASLSTFERPRLGTSNTVRCTLLLCFFGPNLCLIADKIDE